jgi:hypothetical protein
VAAGQGPGGVAYGKLVKGSGGGEITALDAATAQVRGRRRVDVDLKPLDRLAHGREGTRSTLCACYATTRSVRTVEVCAPLKSAHRGSLRTVEVTALLRRDVADGRRPRWAAPSSTTSRRSPPIRPPLSASPRCRDKLDEQ